MKALEIKNYGFPGGLVGLIAHALGQAPVAGRRGGPERVASAPTDANPDGGLQRLGRWLRRQMRKSVDAGTARASNVFEALDRWFWKEQMRETEAWLAQSNDVFELEARIRRLERGPSRL